jgi:hypothetical protein
MGRSDRPSKSRATYDEEDVTQASYAQPHTGTNSSTSLCEMEMQVIGGDEDEVLTDKDDIDE